MRGCFLIDERFSSLLNSERYWGSDYNEVYRGVFWASVAFATEGIVITD